MNNHVLDQQTSKRESYLAYREWWNLKQCCERKGLAYKSACNRTTLQPNGGTPDGHLNGRKVWHWSTVETWLGQLDDTAR